jgi:Tfp pilus assembly protein PilX
MINHQNKHIQQGSTLLITLIFMLLLSMVALSMARTATLNLNISGQNMDRQRAFLLSEGGLQVGEDNLEALGVEHGCDNSESSCFASKFQGNTDCTGGYCFSGLYTPGNTNTVPAQPLVCNINDAVNNGKPAHQIKDNWNNAIQSGDSKYLIEFRCYVLAQGINPNGVLPDIPDGSAWNALFRITTLTETDDGSRVMLQRSHITQAAIVPSVSGLFSVNSNLDLMAGTSLDTYYCKYCTTANINAPAAYIAGADPLEVFFDPADIPAISHGGTITYWNDNPLNPGQIIPVAPPAIPVVGGKPAITSVQGTPIDYYSGPEQITQISGDNYFAQHFGKTDRQDIYDQADVTVNSNGFNTLDFSTLNATAADPKIIVVNGNLTLPSIDKRATGSEYVTIIVKGNVIAPNTAYAAKFSMMYIEGNLNWSGVQEIQGVLAVEGSATLNTSLAIRPESDPRDALPPIDPADITWAQNSWNEVIIDF